MTTPQISSAVRLISRELRNVEGSLAYRTVLDLDVKGCKRLAAENHNHANDALELADRADAGSPERTTHEHEAAKRTAIAHGYDLAAQVKNGGPFDDDLLDELSDLVSFYKCKQAAFLQAHFA